MSDAAAFVHTSRLSSVAEYAYAAQIASGSRLVLTAGACPLDASGTTVAPGDVRAQADQVMTNLHITLTESGASLTDLVRTTIYVASDRRQDLVDAWEVIRDRLAPHAPPSTLLGVTVLGYEHQLVEVDAVAAVLG